VELIVGQERIVFVERNVRVGIPSELREHLRVQSAAGALYLEADAPINTTRVQLQDTSTGELILLDVSAQPAAADQLPLEPLHIDVTKKPAQDSGVDSPATEETRRTPVPVVLTRYAAQSLYAPLRTIDSVHAITPVPLRPHRLTGLLPNLPISAEVLASWRLDDFWVTAVMLTNTDTRSLVLDPRDLQGNLFAATFQHRNLGAAGDPTDTSVVYLVTRGHGLSAALPPNVSPFDASAGSPTASGRDIELGHAK
jgi:integrating conjugative element protein (TIGR03749 family)